MLRGKGETMEAIAQDDLHLVSETTGRDLHLMDIHEVQAALHNSHAQVYNLINAGELTRVKIGRRAFVTRESLILFLERRVAESEQESKQAKTSIGSPKPELKALRSNVFREQTLK